MATVSEVELIKGSELPYATKLLSDEKFIVVQSGITKTMDVTVLNGLLTQATYLEGTFTNNDLVDGKLYIDHGLNTDKIIVFIKNPSGENQWLGWKNPTPNQSFVDFGGPIEPGIHKFVLLYWKAGSDFSEQTAFKTIPIGMWNVAGSMAKAIPHGLDADKIIAVTAVIFSDPGTDGPYKRWSLPGAFDGSHQCYMWLEYNNTNINVRRSGDLYWGNVTGGGSAGLATLTGDANRGFIHITYRP